MKKILICLFLALSMLLVFASTAFAGEMLDNGRYSKLVVAIDSDPQDLEGDDVNLGSRYYWIYGVYEPLFDFADDSSGALLPCMAKSYEEVDGGKSWLVTLNDDIYDWDGNYINYIKLKSA